MPKVPCGDGDYQKALNMPFTTYDADHDTNTGSNCAVEYQGAWWYSTCHSANLNGLYVNGTTDQFATSDVWCPWRGYFYGLTKVEMKIKPYLGTFFVHSSLGRLTNNR
jgi:ficolin